MDWNILFRPRTWDAVLGQNHLKPIIQQALLADRFPKFSLFTGPSGMGKSSLAELVAMSLSCSNSLSEPCGRCDNCRAFLNGNSRVVKKFNMAKMLGKKDIISVLDEIFEFESIDGQTIYILEEVHVLKDNEQSPFLEELTRIPDDVYIIMCTTQPYKVLSEIRNRAITFNCEVPTTGQCQEFIKKVCRSAGIGIPPDTTIRTLTEVCENTPRKIIATLQLFSSGDQLTAQMLSEFFGLAEERVYIDLLEKLHSSVSFFQFAEFIESFADNDISAVKVVKGFDNFMVDVLLERSSRRKFALLQEGERLDNICKTLGEVGILKIMNFISKKDYTSARNESSAKYFLLQLKLDLLNNVTGNTNLSIAAATKIEANESARQKEAEQRTSSTAKDVQRLTGSKLIQASASMFFLEGDDDDNPNVNNEND